MQLTAYLNFNGNCREAFAHYQKALGGEITAMATWGASPAAEHVPPEAHDQIIHASLVLDSGAQIMASDTPGEMFEKASGTSVCVQVDDAATAERVFSALSEGGTIKMPMEGTFFAERFGMAIDRFGIPWMVIFGGDVEYQG